MIRQFLQRESAGGIVLFIMALLAMLWANSPLATIHQHFINQFLFIINDGLMVVFFLLVGLELKRSYLDGQLSRLSEVMLPFFAALGGMVVPVMIYYWLNAGNPDLLKGWATPVATDIAFALGVLTLFGKRVPVSLKLFLLTLAIFDDIGAIIIIALFYSTGLSLPFLLGSCVLVGGLFLLNHRGVQSLIPYLIIGVLLWLGLLFGGVHPTIAGVLLAFVIPAKSDHRVSPLHKLEENLHGWVVFIILPLFVLANAGFSLQELTFASLTDRLVLGITLGLFVGKQVGVFLFSMLLIRLKFAKLPRSCSWLALYGVSLLCGIGFTMSLFLGTLSFPDEAGYLAKIRLGVIMGSFLSGLLGAIVLLFALRKKGTPAS